MRSLAHSLAYTRYLRSDTPDSSRWCNINVTFFILLLFDIVLCSFPSHFGVRWTLCAKISLFSFCFGFYTDSVTEFIFASVFSYRVSFFVVVTVACMLLQLAHHLFVRLFFSSIVIHWVHRLPLDKLIYYLSLHQNRNVHHIWNLSDAHNNMRPKQHRSRTWRKKKHHTEAWKVERQRKSMWNGDRCKANKRTHKKNIKKKILQLTQTFFERILFSKRFLSEEETSSSRFFYIFFFFIYFNFFKIVGCYI